MKEEDRDKIEEIVGRMSCPKEFRCVESGFENLCRAKDVGLECHLMCLEDYPYQCRFSLVYDSEYFCGCPLRVYIAKHIGK